jgi:hypothetical protein
MSDHCIAAGSTRTLHAERAHVNTLAMRRACAASCQSVAPTIPILPTMHTHTHAHTHAHTPTLLFMASPLLLLSERESPSR